MISCARGVQGRKYDASGNLNDWWGDADAAEYQRRVAVQVIQSAEIRARYARTCAEMRQDAPIAGGRGTDGAVQRRRHALAQVAQADAVVVEGQPLKGALTCGENIADLGGLKLALAALRTLRAGGEGGEGKGAAGGFTPEQRFFLSWAQARDLPKYSLQTSRKPRHRSVSRQISRRI